MPRPRGGRLGIGSTAMALRRRLSALPSIAADSLLTLLAALFAFVNFLASPRGPAALSGWALPLALLCAAALLLRSRWPLITLLAVGVAGSAYLVVTGQPTIAILPSVFIALYSAIAYSRVPRLRTWLCAVGVCLVLVSLNLVGHEVHAGPHEGPHHSHTAQAPSATQSFYLNLPEPAGQFLVNAGWMLTGLVLGEAMRGRRSLAQEAEMRAAQAERAHREAERAQQEFAQRRVAEERLQIARELHDVLAHTVALINVQAGVAAHVIDQQPEQAREALQTIRQASHETLQELLALVGVLRENDADTPRTPTAGLDALESLIATARDAGLTVEAHVARTDVPLPATVDVAAYRIVQEALTNVIKHAGPVAVHVKVRQDAARLELDVVNDRDGDRPGQGPGSGHGILGMRERAAALGGTVEAGPLPAGGFHVHASLPIPGGNA